LVEWCSVGAASQRWTVPRGHQAVGEHGALGRVGLGGDGTQLQVARLVQYGAEDLVPSPEPTNAFSSGCSRPAIAIPIQPPNASSGFVENRRSGRKAT
jgi:hypothetical protein